MQSPFRTWLFALATSMFALDLVFCAFVLFGCWRHSNFQVGFLVIFVLIYLVGVWRLGCRTHEKIHVLFDSGQIETLEKQSALDQVLSATTGMILGGLLTSFVLAGFSLAAISEVLFSH